MLRQVVHYYWPLGRAREIREHPELIPRWGLTGLALFAGATAPVWPELVGITIDPFLLARTVLASCGLVFSCGAVAISIASIRPGRRW